MAVAPMVETDVRLLSDEQVAFYHENGYLVVEDVLAAEELQALRDETARICRGERGLVQGLPDFDPSESDEDIIARTICVHFPHKISDVMLDAVGQPGIVEVLTQLIGPNVKCMQSMLFIKSAGKPGQAWHQDEAFIPTRDCSLTAAWMALEDATPETAACGPFRVPTDCAPSGHSGITTTTATTVHRSPSTSRSRTMTESWCRPRPAQSFSSTAISCTGPCQTTRSRGSAGPWSTTT